MLFTFLEIFDILLMTAVIAFIFKDTFKVQKKYVDVLDKYMQKASKIDWQDYWFAASVTAPAIIIHEFGHKFVALSFGLTAEFNASYFWLAIAIILKLISFPVLFFVPAYVSISGDATLLQQLLIAFAGPAINLILFLLGFVISKKKKIKHRTLQFWMLTRNINGFLFIFNILPIPGFDGFTVFSSLWHMFF